MKALCSGITTLFNAGGAFATAVGNRFYLLEAPDKAKYPYCIYGPSINDAEWQFNSSYERVTIRFEIYSDSRAGEEVLDLYENLKLMFDQASLTVSGYTQVSMNRLTAGLDKVEDPGTGEMLWIWEVEYECLLRQN